VEFFGGNVGFGLQAGIDDHEVLVDAHDFGGDDFAGTHFLALEAFLESHITAVRDQTWEAPVGPLTVQQRGTHGWQGRHFRGTDRDFLGTDGVGHIGLVQKDAAAGKARRQARRHGRQSRLIVQGLAGAQSGQRRQPIQGTTVEVVVAKRRRHAFGYRALARGRGTIDGDHRRGHFGKGIEVTGKSLVHTRGVIDRHRNTTQGSPAKNTSPCGGRRRCRWPHWQSALLAA
jgi:hypothetical protein